MPSEARAGQHRVLMAGKTMQLNAQKCPHCPRALTAAVLTTGSHTEQRDMGPAHQPTGVTCLPNLPAAEPSFPLGDAGFLLMKVCSLLKATLEQQRQREECDFVSSFVKHEWHLPRVLLGKPSRPPLASAPTAMALPQFHGSFYVPTEAPNVRTLHKSKLPHN